MGRLGGGDSGVVVHRNAGQVGRDLPTGEGTDQVRYVTVGRDLRPLCTEDPKKQTPLPGDSDAWDQGVGISFGAINTTDVL